MHPSPSEAAKAPRKLIEDTLISRLSPSKESLPRNPSYGTLKPYEQQVLRSSYSKPVPASHRLTSDTVLHASTVRKPLQKPTIHISPQKGVSGSSRELLQYVRSQNSGIGSTKMTRLPLIEDPNFPESEPNTSRRHDSSISPLPRTRKATSRQPETTATPSVLLPKVVVRFAHRTRTGSIEGIPKPQNQDNYLILHDFAGCKYQFLLGVYDGHGVNGHLVSEYIKKNLPHALEQHYPRLLRQADSGLDPAIERNSLNTAFIGAYIDIHHDLMRKSRIDCNFSGSTAVTVLIRGSTAMCANSGDSRAVIGVKSNGQWSALPLSRDHKPDDPGERGRIEQMGGRVEPFKGKG